jgi:hypothetical protein
MNEDIVASAEGEAAVMPETQTAGEQRERSVVLLLEALEGRLATPEYRELLRILAPATVESSDRGTGNG